MRRTTGGTGGIYLVFATTFLVAVALIVRLFFIQIIDGKEYEALAASQYIRPVHQLFNRGDIYMQPREGKLLPVALMKETYTLFISPQALSNPEELYPRINEITPINKEHYLESASKPNDPYEILATGLESEIAERIAELNTIGVATHPERERYYPAGSLASQTIGFMSYDEDSLRGMYGIERQFDELLTDPSTRKHVNIFAEILLNNSGSAEASIETADIVLTIEPSVQVFVEKELEDYRAAFNAERAGAIIMDPRTGEIISMASSPQFNLNDFRNADPNTFSNPNVSNVYEMGSIMKALTIAAGLDSGAITPESTFNDLGYISADGARITNVYKGARGTTKIQGILNHSMNTGASWIVGQMGKKKFAEYFYNFGLDEKTNIKLPNEASGLLTNLESPRTVEYYTASFGQGIATTPIATVRALASLGNGGLLVEPYLVKEIRYANGEVEKPERDEPKRVLKEQTSEDISRMLVNVADVALLGGEKSISTHTVALKTGTAQMPDPSTGKYSETDFLHSYFGYFPAYDPEFIVFLYAEKPSGSGYASQTLTDPFFRITNFLIDYYAIKPDR
ncbi:MAG: penicillin-binding protein 2 [Candidatus Paceibacterota bacterium]